ncbi:MAG: hypothetical protein K0S51_862 [Bacillales bacterium]|nr:hypothetical protein [Bacillales bacterium]
MDLNRAMYKKKALYGYNPEDVHKHIQNRNKNHQKELEVLKSRLQDEKSINKRLKNEIKEKNQLPLVNPIENELNKMLMDVFKSHTTEILERKKELKKIEELKQMQLEEKERLLELSTERLNEALKYLKNISTQQFHEIKGLEQ